MSRKHNKMPLMPTNIKISDYTKSKHTRNNFKKFLQEAKYNELLEKYQEYKHKLLMYNISISKTKTLYDKVKGNPMENYKIVKWKYNLLSNKLNLITLKEAK